MPLSALTETATALDILNVLVSVASAAQDQALQMARTTTEILTNSEDYAALENLATQLQKTATDIQLRLQMIQDAAVKLGAERPVNACGAPLVDFRPKNSPAARHLLDAVTNATAAARALDREMGWLNEEGHPIGYYERYAMGKLLLQTELENPQE